jgi:hypothetical protein
VTYPDLTYADLPSGMSVAFCTSSWGGICTWADQSMHAEASCLVHKMGWHW